MLQNQPAVLTKEHTIEVFTSSVTEPVQGCELHHSMCCKTMSDGLTEERMSCNSERVLILRSVSECISAETERVAASIQTSEAITGDTVPPPSNPEKP